jgi:hypothetical protein
LWLLLLFLAGNSAGESVEDIAMRWYLLGFAIHSSGLLIGWGLRRFEAFLLGGAA